MSDVTRSRPDSRTHHDPTGDAGQDSGGGTGRETGCGEELIGPAAIERARGRLAGQVRATPVVRSEELDAAAGSRIWLKAENLQSGGSFKVRGAWLAIDTLMRAGCRGVVAQSTGNHAIAVAAAAAGHRLPAVLVLPTDAAAVKVARVTELGGRVVRAGRTLAERLEAVRRVCDRLGYDVVDPYENPDVVAGQGTATAELLTQVRQAGGRLDAVVVPVGGGSAIAGACLAASGRGPAVIGAEPAAVPALTAALAAGRPVTVAAAPTMADGLRPERIGALPFAVTAPRVGSVVTVSEAEIAEALRLAALRARLVVEPAAAAALAVALRCAGQLGPDVGVLLSGGNVDPAVLAGVLGARARS